MEMWRRGIADVEAESGGSTVDGEFITPGAMWTLIAEGKLTEGDLKARYGRNKTSRKRRSSRNERSERSSKSKVSEKTGTERKKEQWGIRMLFKGHIA